MKIEISLFSNKYNYLNKFVKIIIKIKSRILFKNLIYYFKIFTL